MSKLYPKLQTGGLFPDKSQKTKLTQGQQLAYEKWKSENKYNESDDYDLAGYWKEQGMKNLSFPNLSPIEKFKEIESKDFPQLDDFYKNNKNTAGMYHGEGTISRNLYSDRSPRALNKVMELEKMRGVLEENRNDPNLPKLNFKIRREDNNAFKTNKQYSIRENPESKNAIHYIDTNKKTRRETIASRVYIGDALLNQGTNSYVEPSEEQIIQTKRLSDYAHSKPYHLPDKFKRLAPFSNGDGYMQLSDESNVASQFDKRGQGFWQGNQFIGYQSGGTLSQLGYKRHSPYNKASSLLIHTPTGSITMKEVDHPILGISKGEIKFMLPNKEYQFKSNQVLEIPMKSLYPKGQNGMKIPKLNSLQKDSLDLYNYSQLQKKLQGSKTLKEDDSWFKNPIDYLINELDSFRGYKENTKQFFQNSKYNEIREKDLHRISKGRNIEQLTSSNKKLWEVGDNLVKNNPNITYMNPLNSPDLFHKTILKTGNHGDTNNAVSFDYKKPSFYDSYYQEKNKKPVGENNAVIASRLSSIKPATPQKTTKNSTIQEKEKPIVERMSEMTPIQTIQPQVQDTLVQRPIIMKTIYPSKPHVWNTSTPKRHSVERAPGLGGYNRIYQEGGQAPEMSPEQQQEIVRRVRNLRKKLPKMGVAYDPISFRHAMYVNKKAFDKEDQELLGAFDEDTMVKLMNEIPNDNQPTYKKGGSIKGKSKMYPKCKCGCGGVSVGKNKMFQQGGMTPTDSLRHQASKIMDYEALRGSQYGTGLPNYGNPQIQSGDKQGAINYFMNSVAPHVNHFKSAMEKGEAGDFVYNTGRDPRIYMLDQFIKSKGNQQGLPNRGSYNLDMKSPEWNNKKQEFETEWSKYSNDIQNLPENQRRVLLNKGRDFYYQNIDKQNGQPNPAYKNTWYGRIWNTNDFKPFNPNNPNFSPKYQQGGTMDVLDGEGNSQMTITGGERIFSRIATKRMRQLNEEGNYKELGKFICDELYAQDKRDPQYVKE
mgnify:FL=1